MAEKRYNWGIVSTGEMAGNFSSAFCHTSASQIRGVSSRFIHKAEQFARDRGIPRAYGSLDDMLNDSDIEIIYIASPHTEHAGQIQKALEAEKHVVCEKPITINAHELKICRQIAGDKKLFLMEAMWMRFFPLMTEIIHIIQNGILGEIQYITADFFLNSPSNSSPRLYDLSLGGGALLDLGIYPLSLVQMLTGSLEAVTGFSQRSPEGVDILDSLSVKSRSGALASLGCGLTCRKPREAVVNGTEGYLKIHDIFFKPDTMTVFQTGKDAREICMPYCGNGYIHEIRHVEECLSRGLTESPVMPLEQNSEIMTAMDTLRKQWGIRYPGEELCYV